VRGLLDLGHESQSSNVQQTHVLTCFARHGRYDNRKPYIDDIKFPGVGKLSDGKKVLNMNLDVFGMSAVANKRKQALR
jgi:hypothetical protein